MSNANNQVFKLPIEPTVMVMLGKPRSGKSFLIKSFIHEWTVKQKYFTGGGIVMCSTAFNKGYDWVPKPYLWKDWYQDKLQAYFDHLGKLAEAGHEIKPWFLILDDMMGKMVKNNDFMEHLVSSYRHYKVTVIISSQYMVGNLSPLVRECANEAFIWRMKTARSLTNTYEAYGNDMGKDRFKALLEWATEEQYRCLLYQDLQHNETSKAMYSAFKAPNTTINFKLNYDLPFFIKNEQMQNGNRL